MLECIVGMLTDINNNIDITIITITTNYHHRGQGEKGFLTLANPTTSPASPVGLLQLLELLQLVHADLGGKAVVVAAGLVLLVLLVHEGGGGEVVLLQVHVGEVR